MKNNDDIKKLQRKYRIGGLWHLMCAAANGANFIAQIKDLVDRNANIQREFLVDEILNRLKELEIKVEELETKILTDEAEELFNYSLIKAADCYKKEQITKMADVIIAALIQNKISKDDAEVLLSIISELNNSEAETFLEIYNNLKDKQNISLKLAFEIKTLSKAKYVDLIDRLIAKGLMKKQIYTTDLMWDANMPLKDIKYQFTYFGVLFIKIIYKQNINYILDSYEVK